MEEETVPAGAASEKVTEAAPFLFLHYAAQVYNFIEDFSIQMSSITLQEFRGHTDMTSTHNGKYLNFANQNTLIDFEVRTEKESG